MKKNTMNLSDREVMIVGLGKSGIGAAKLALSHGARVTVCDGKPEEKVREIMSGVSGIQTVISGRNPSPEEAVRMDIIVPSPAVPADADFLVAAREAGVTVWSEIEFASRFCDARVIGITGTNGKTTTTTLVGEIAAKVWPGSLAAGNIGLAFTEVAEEIPAEAVAVLELSSFQLETIDGFHPQVAAILNLSPDHLNRHHTYENYIAAKCRIFEYQTESDALVLNYDDERLRVLGTELMRRQSAPRVVFFSREILPEGGIGLKDGWIVADGSLTGRKDWTALAEVEKMQIFGPHNEENAMAAAACLLMMGAPQEAIREGLYAFKGVAHRIEFVGEVDGVPYYNDSKATNPDAAIKGILAMKSEKTVLLGGGYDKGTPYDDWTRLFPGRVRSLILIGQTREDILASAVANGFDRRDIYLCDTFEDAIAKAREEARPGDSVLLSPACASWGMFDNYEQRGDLFRAMVQAMH